MLALRTGWTPRTIGGDDEQGVSADIRRALHFALFAEALAPIYEDARQALLTPTHGLTPKEFGSISRARMAAHHELETLRRVLHLEAPPEQKAEEADKDG